MSSICLLLLRRMNLLLPGCCCFFLKIFSNIQEYFPSLISVACSKGSCAFHIVVYVSHSNFGVKVTHYYVVAAGFLVHSFLKFFKKQLHCFVVVVACRGIDLYNLQ